MSVLAGVDPSEDNFASNRIGNQHMNSALSLDMAAKPLS